MKIKSYFQVERLEYEFSILYFSFYSFILERLMCFYVCNMLERECEKRVIPSGPTHLDLPPTACEQNLRR